MEAGEPNAGKSWATAQAESNPSRTARAAESASTCTALKLACLSQLRMTERAAAAAAVRVERHVTFEIIPNQVSALCTRSSGFLASAILARTFTT
jgi:hypothetical protein